MSLAWREMKTFRGLLQNEKNILFTHIFPNLCDLLSSMEHKRRWYSFCFFFYFIVWTKNTLNIFQISFCVPQKECHTMPRQTFHFWENHHFNCRNIWVLHRMCIECGCKHTTAVVLNSGGGHDHDREADGRWEDPVTHVDNLGVPGGSEVQGFNRVANSNVTVDAHSGEGKDTGEHVVVINGHHDLAQHISKRPRTHQVIHTLER